MLASRRWKAQVSVRQRRTARNCRGVVLVRFVTPYRMSGARGKNDAADAAAICEAVQRPAMRVVPVKSIDQQARLNKSDAISRWAIALEQRRGYWKAVVAIAAKNARMCWAMLAHGEAFMLPA
jgi:transposase